MNSLSPGTMLRRGRGFLVSKNEGKGASLIKSPGRWRPAVTGFLAMLSLTCTGEGGSIVTWDQNGNSKQQEVPEVWEDVVGAAAGYDNSVVLSRDGTVRQWGRFPGTVPVPPLLSEVDAVFAGGGGLAMLTDGSVVEWGAPYPRKAGQGDETGYVSFAAGWSSTLALREDGTVEAWGHNSFGSTNVPSGLSAVRQVAINDSRPAALRMDGSLVMWGLSPVMPNPVPAGLIAIAAGTDHLVGLKSDGTVVAWGANNYHQTEVPPGLFDVVQVAATEYLSLALKRDGTVVQWGANSSVPAAATRIFSISAGGRIVALKGSADTAPEIVGPSRALVGTAGVGTGYYRIMAANSPASFAAAGLPPGLFLNTFTGVVSGTCTATGSFDVQLSATNAHGTDTRDITMIVNGQPTLESVTKDQFMVGSPASATVIATYGATVTAQGLPEGLSVSPTGVISGTPLRPGTYTAKLKLSNVWGERTYDWGVDITPLIQWMDIEYPWQCPRGLTDAVDFSNGFGNKIVLKKDGTVRTWRQANGGYYTDPGVVSGVAVAAGVSHFAAVLSDGSVVVWGDNSKGQMIVPPGLKAAGVACSEDCVIALRTDGTVVAWGTNQWGILNVPPGLSDVVAISAGERAVTALKADGTTVSWGMGTMPPLTNVRAVAVSGTDFSWALKNDGTVIPSDPFVAPPSTVTNVIALRSAGAQAAVITSTGKIITWGRSLSSEPAWAYPAAVAQPGMAITGSPGAAPRVCGPGVAVFGSVPTGGAYYRIPVANGPATFTSTALPQGLVLNAATGELTGNPTETGVFSADFTATNAAGSDTRTLKLVIHGKPRYIGPAATVFPLGVSRSQSLELAGNPVVTAQDLPPGLTISPAGLLTGTPQRAGRYMVQLHLQNALSQSDAVWNVEITPVVAWTQINFENDPFPVPAGLSDTIAVANGDRHALALKADGTVTAWGENYFGQSAVPAGLRDVIAIAAGSSRSVALRSDGTLVAWGLQSTGPNAPPAWLREVVAVTPSLALLRNGTVARWTNNGEIVNGLSGVTAIAESSGYSYSFTGYGAVPHFLALKADGTVTAWGLNTKGQATVPAGLTDVVDIAAGGEISLALKRDGTVVSWGVAGYAPPSPLTGVVDIAAGNGFALALKSDGTVVQWPESSSRDDDMPPGLRGVTALAGGGSVRMVFAGGENTAPRIVGPSVILGNTGAGSRVYHRVSATGGNVTWSAAGLPQGVTIDPATGVISGTADMPGTYTINLSAANAAGTATRTVTLVINGGPDFAGAMQSIFSLHQPVNTSVSLTPGTTILEASALPPGIIIHNDGKVLGTPTRPGQYAVQLRLSNSFGTNMTTWHTEVTPVVVWGGNNEWGQSSLAYGLHDAVAVVAAPEARNLVLKKDGTVIGWGYDQYGYHRVPADLRGVKAIDASNGHSLALLEDGTVRAWGSPLDSATVVPTGLSGVTAVSASPSLYSLALRSNGTVAAWGQNDYGVVSGVGSVYGVKQIAAAYFSGLALRNDGTVLGWGNAVPGTVVPAGLNSVTAIAAGSTHALALKSDGTIVAWSDVPVPVPANVNANVVAISADTTAGSATSMALQRDGTVTVWGSTNSQKSLPGCIAIDCGPGQHVALIGTLPFGQVIAARTGTPLTWQVPAILTADQYTASPLPPGLMFETGTRTLALTPAKEGLYTVKLTAMSAGMELTGDITLAIAPVGPSDSGAAATAYLAWVATHWGASGPGTGPGEDPDADGNLNLMEWATGSDPRVPNLPPPVIASLDSAGRLTMEMDITTAAWVHQLATGQFAENTSLFNAAGAVATQPSAPVSVVEGPLLRVKFTDSSTGPRRAGRVQFTLP